MNRKVMKAAVIGTQQMVLQLGYHHHRLLLQATNFPNQSPPRQDSGGRGLNPSVVIIVVILTVVFLLSGFLHLLARCCGRVAARREPTETTMSALHGQLQHLFHLHDSGVDQSFIDTLPVFPYKAISGLKEGTDCAVCLSEFESEDRLRLLPKCKHAFHIDCIDTWLLSHSTCPICRCPLLSDDVTASNEAFSDSGRLGSNRSIPSDGYVGDSRRTSDMSRRRIASSSMLAEHGGGSGSSELGKEDDDTLPMGMGSPEIQPVLDRSASEASVGSVLSVKLGRVERRSTSGSVGPSSVLRGRSYSMGSYEYVLDPANLQVIIAPTPYPGRGNSGDYINGAKPRHRSVFSDGIPEIGSIPGTPADELFWATRGLATPEYGMRGMGTPEFLSAKTPDFLTSMEEGNVTSRLNLGQLASEASLVPRKEKQLGGLGKGENKTFVEGKGKEKVVDEIEGGNKGSEGGKGKEKVEEGKGKEKLVEEGNSYTDEFVTVHVERKEEVGTSYFAQSAVSPLQEVVFQEKAAPESEESRILAGLERFFGAGWRSNVGIEKLTETMSRRDKAGSVQDGTSSRSKAASDQGGESVKDNSTSRRTFSFRFPVPESLSRKSRRSSRSPSRGLEPSSKEPSVFATAFDTASKDTGYETASKDLGGFETASKESLAGLDASSIGSFDSSWLTPPPQQPLPEQEGVDNHNESNQQASSLARKTIHWLMGRDRRIVPAANFSPSAEVGNQHTNDENL